MHSWLGDAVCPFCGLRRRFITQGRDTGRGLYSIIQYSEDGEKWSKHRPECVELDRWWRDWAIENRNDNQVTVAVTKPENENG